jgi:hypothetical protein
VSEFARTWISTEEQLRVLADSYQGASMLRKLAGAFEFPSSAAHLQGWFMPWMRSPTVFTAVGHLVIGETRIQFRPAAPKLLGWRLRNIDRTLVFDIAATEITAADAYAFKSPFSKMFDLPFTRLKTSKPGILADFLLCIGHPLSPPTVRVRSLALQVELQRFGSALSRQEALPKN